MKMTATCQLLVEVYKEPNQLLVQDPLDELGHLLDEARFQAVSEGNLPDEPAEMAASLEPVYKSDTVFLDGIRVRIWHENRKMSHEVLFPRAIAGHRGTLLANQMIAQGRLEKGDRYRIQLAAMDRTPSRENCGSGDADPSDVVEQPFPVQERSLRQWNISPAAIKQADPRRPVFVAQAVLDQAIKEAIAHGDKETGTLLLGHLVESPEIVTHGNAHSWSVVITEQLPVPDGTGTASSFIFPPESFQRARQLSNLRGQGEMIIGTQHSHGWRCHECDKHCEIRNLFFSSDDEIMARQFPVYAVFLVVGGNPERERERPVVNLYVRRQGIMQPIPFGIFEG